MIPHTLSYAQMQAVIRALRQGVKVVGCIRKLFGGLLSRRYELDILVYLFYFHFLVVEVD